MQKLACMPPPSYTLRWILRDVGSDGFPLLYVHSMQNDTCRTGGDSFPTVLTRPITSKTDVSRAPPLRFALPSSVEKIALKYTVSPPPRFASMSVACRDIVYDFMSKVETHPNPKYCTLNPLTMNHFPRPHALGKPPLCNLDSAPSQPVFPNNRLPRVTLR